MRNTTILFAAAPLALLAACGDAETDDTMDADATTVATADADPTAASEDDYTPGPATALADAGDYSGNYSYTASDGSQQGITINSKDKTYSYFGPDGLTRTGDYTWTPDGFRIMIPEWSEGPTWFVIREGQLVRLDEDKEFNAETVVEGERYARDDDNAMFSREPELGSPVAPRD